MSMDSIREDLVGVVHVYVDDESVFLRAGDEVPEGLQVREDVLADEQEADLGDGVPDDDLVEPDGSELGNADEFSGDVDDEDMPADYDSRESWNAYAESVGFDPSPFSKKEALIEALKQR